MNQKVSQMFRIKWGYKADMFFLKLFENYTIEFMLLQKHKSVSIHYKEPATDMRLSSWKNHGRLIVSTLNG